MLQVKSLLKYWLPVAIWMGVIFSASTDVMSSPRTSRIIGPIVHWLMPDLPEETVARIVTAVRKTGHMTEYGILALLVWRARRKPTRRIREPWRWSEARFALAFAAAYAISDELHQSLVPSRQASAWDVLLDVLGASLALSAFWLWGRFTARWQPALPCSGPSST